MAERYSAVVPGRVAYDRDLSAKAKGVMLVIMAVADGKSTFGIGEVKDYCKEGRSALYAAISELTDKHYITRNQERDNGGTFGAASYTITAWP